MTIRCIIIDDEYLAVRVLEGFCARVPDVAVLGSFKDPREAVSFMQSSEVDLIFLDIQMPHISGAELAGRISSGDLSLPGADGSSRIPLIAFTTARHEFAVQAFELDALDYLVKPIAFGRFEKTIRKAREYWLSSGPLTPDAGEVLFIKSDHRTIRLPYSDIILIEGLNEYVKVHTRDRKIITLAALKELEATLPEKRFVRIHRSYIVSLEQMRSWSTSEVEMTGGLRLPVGRVYKENFLRQAGRWKGFF
jgi:DNA-binding LytR/AlgR family response regulator